MKRGDGLQRRVALARGPIKPARGVQQRRTARTAPPDGAGRAKGGKRAKEPTRDVRDVVAARSKGRCEVRLDGCLGDATNVHHRQRRGEGVHTAANLLHLCGSGTTGCHGWITEHPAASRDAGWMVSAWADPAAEPVIIAGRGLVWLTEDGKYVGEVRGPLPCPACDGPMPPGVDRCDGCEVAS